MTANTKEFYDRLKQRTVLILNHIISKIDNKAQIDGISDKLVAFNAPTVFDGGEFERKFDKDFETMCLVISKEFNVNVKKMTTLEYFNAYEFIVRQDKERRKHAANKKSN